MNRFFTRIELIDAYRLPKHVQDRLLTEVVPVEKDNQGEPLLLEAHIDAWLTAQYSVSLWRSGSGLPSIPPVPHSEPLDEDNSFVTVAEAQCRYLGGERSKRWWYRLVETGSIAHHRIGDSIFFRTDDIEKFIAEPRKAEQTEAPRPEPAPAIPVVPQPVKRQARRKPGEDTGFRFFQGETLGH